MYAEGDIVRLTDGGVVRLFRNKGSRQQDIYPLMYTPPRWGDGFRSIHRVPCTYEGKAKPLKVIQADVAQKLHPDEYYKAGDIVVDSQGCLTRIYGEAPFWGRCGVLTVGCPTLEGITVPVEAISGYHYHRSKELVILRKVTIADLSIEFSVGEKVLSRDGVEAVLQANEDPAFPLKYLDATGYKERTITSKGFFIEDYHPHKYNVTKLQEVL